MKKEKESVLVYTTKPLSGAYSSKYFNIFPSQVSNKQFYSALLEFELTVDEPYLRYSNNNGDILSKKIIELNMLLSLFSQFFFFDFQISKKPIKKFTDLAKIPSMQFGTIQWYQDKTLDDGNIESLIFPKEMDQILQKYFMLKENNLKIFRQALSLFYSGIELKPNYQSQSFLCFVSAIETLTQLEFESENDKIKIHGCCKTIIESPWKCPTCKSDIWGISHKYREFVIKYAFNSNISKHERALVSKIYSIRSKIVHYGQLLVSDDFWNEEHAPDWTQSFIHKDLLHITRLSLINWLLNVN